MVATKCIEKLIVLTWAIICWGFFWKKKGPYQDKTKQMPYSDIVSRGRYFLSYGIWNRYMPSYNDVLRSYRFAK